MIEAMNEELWTDLSIEELAAGGVNPDCSPVCCLQSNYTCNFNG